MKLLVRAATLSAAAVRSAVRFAKRLVVGSIIRQREERPGLDAKAPCGVHVIFRLAALAGMSLCLAILWLVVPSVIEALKSPAPWTREGLAVLLVVAWVGCDALRYGRLAVSQGVPSQLREL